MLWQMNKLFDVKKYRFQSNVTDNVIRIEMQCNEKVCLKGIWLCGFYSYRNFAKEMFSVVNT